MNDSNIKFDQVIEALLDEEHPFPNRFLRSFSDLSPKDLLSLSLAWPQVKSQRKTALLEDLEAIAETDTLVNFDELAKMAITDPDPSVRVLAVRSLWECEETKLIPTFTELMHGDESSDVRAAAAAALGKFVYLGEVDLISDELRILNNQNLLDVVTGNDLPHVRRRALESLGYSSHAKVPGLILKALATEETQWLTSALCAISRSADDKWSEQVIKFLNHPDVEVQFEAVRAAGELEMEDARDHLLEMLEDKKNDPELHYALIWALSQIGGEGIKQKFEDMSDKSTDEEEIEWLEKGLDNLELSGSLGPMEMLDLGISKPENEEEWESPLDDTNEEELENE